MNILFVLYWDFSSNSANPLALYARELHLCGHSCAVAVPNNLETVQQFPNPSFRPLLYGDVLNNPELVFPDGRPADVIHAWTPREVVRRFVTSYMAKRPTPLVVYLEDHELWIACRALGLEEATLVQQTEQSISERVPDALSHPFRYDSFIGLADAAAVIQDKLEIDVPPWVHCETVMPGVDLEFFFPRVANPLLRKQYGVAENERVIVYPGGLNGFTKPAIETLCRAVGLINSQGYPCKLLRTGPFALDFIDQLPPEAGAAINDLGVLPRSDLPDLLALADVFVQPGKIDPFEDLRLPGKLPEYLAMGRPVIMPNVNIAHLLKDGVDAVLTTTGSAEEIATKCIGLFSDPQQADRIGQAGRRFAEKYFDIKSQTKRMANVYKIACDNFNPTIAAEVWGTEDENTPVAILLARKLRLLADLHSTKFSFEAGEILREHARYIELMQLRVRGLETGIVERDKQIAKRDQAVAERDGQIANLNQAVAERDGRIAHIFQSRSWRWTSPYRLMGYQARRAIAAYRFCSTLVRAFGGSLNLAKKTYSVICREGFGGVVLRAKNSLRYYKTTGAVISHVSYLTYRKEEHLDLSLVANGPTISVVMPVYNTPIDMLIVAIESVCDQIYEKWELVIVDDKSTNPEIKKVIEQYAEQDERITACFREVNGNISNALNSGIELVRGDFVAVLDHDDKLDHAALYWVARSILDNPSADYIYTDEDKISKDGQICYGPFFKPDWSPEYILAMMYTCHLGIYRTSILRRIGGYRPEFDGAQDFDLTLRYLNQTNNVIHIPRVLYHWRVWEQSTAQSLDAKPYAEDRARRALSDFLDSRNERYEICGGPLPGHHQVKFLPKGDPFVSIVIPTANGIIDINGISERHIDAVTKSIFDKTKYTNYELIVVHNGNLLPEQEKLFNKQKNLTLVHYDSGTFSLSEKINLGCKYAKGEYFVIMNDDVRVISEDWLDQMTGMIQRDGVGVVGPKLLFPDETIQHAGIVLLGGLPGHAYYQWPKNADGYALGAKVNRNYLAVTGACAITPKWLFDSVGGYSPRYPLNYNDVDYCLKLHRMGYRSVYLANVELYHYEGVSKEGGRRVSDLEIQKFLEDWKEIYSHDPYYNPNLSQSAPYQFR